MLLVNESEFIRPTVMKCKKRPPPNHLWCPQQAEQKRRERLEKEADTMKNKYSAKEEADLKKIKQELDKLRQEYKGEDSQLQSTAEI